MYWRPRRCPPGRRPERAAHRFGQSGYDGGEPPVGEELLDQHDITRGVVPGIAAAADQLRRHGRIDDAFVDVAAACEQQCGIVRPKPITRAPAVADRRGLGLLETSATKALKVLDGREWRDHTADPASW